MPADSLVSGSSMPATIILSSREYQKVQPGFLLLRGKPLSWWTYQIERCINTLLGLGRKDDIRRGTLRGKKDPVELPGMLDEYYIYRGCSQESLPTRKRLHEIGLEDVARHLAKNQRLAETECPSIPELLKDSEDVAE